MLATWTVDGFLTLQGSGSNDYDSVLDLATGTAPEMCFSRASTPGGT